MERQAMAAHEALCPAKPIACENAGCGAQVKRADMLSHRAECECEAVECVYPGCDKRLPRKVLWCFVLNPHRGCPYHKFLFCVTR